MSSVDYLKQLGKNVYFFRQNLNISQRHLSLICEIDQRYMSRIELGETNITIKTLYKLSHNLNIPMKILLDLDKYKNSF